MALNNLKRVVAVAVGVCVLSACTGDQLPTTTPVARTTPTPTLASTPTPSQTLTANQSASVEAVMKYFEVLNAVLVGDRSPNDLAKVARGDALTAARRSYNQIVNAGYRVTGGVVASGLKPAAETTDGSRPTISVSFCQDTSQRKIKDKSGESVVQGKATFAEAAVQAWSQQWFVTAFKEGGGTC